MSLVVVHSFPVWLPQTQTWLYHQVRFLPDSVNSHIVCKETQNPDQFALPNIHSLSGSSSRWSRWTTRLLRHADYHLYTRNSCIRLQADLLHSHFGPIGWKNFRIMQLMSSSRIRKMKHVVTFYGQDVDHLPRVKPSWKKRYRDLFGQVDLVLCEGPFMAAKVEELGCPADRIQVHHLGVDLQTIGYEPRQRKKEEPFRILMAAAFRPKKGFLYGLQALEQVALQFDIEITLVGDATGDAESEREKKRIMLFLADSSLAGRVKMTGFLTARELMKTALNHHIYLAPSVTAEDGDSEGGAPVSLIEMAASGMPVISSRHCDIPEIIRHGETGLLADERDVNQIASCLTQLIEHPESWNSLTKNARKYIEMYYNAEKQGRQLYKFYKML